MRLPVALSLVVPSVLSGWSIAASAEEAAGFSGDREYRVRAMTMNLYLGVDLTFDVSQACRAAHGGAGWFRCVYGELWSDVLSTDFPSRAKVLANHIEKAAPDVLGLQEVTTTYRDGVEEQNFLKILQNELQNRSLTYAVATDCQVLDPEASKNPAYNEPYNASSGDFMASLETRTALLVNTKTSSWENSTELKFQAQLPTVGGAPTTYCAAMADVKIMEDDSPFLAVSAHFVPSGAGSIQDEQAKELVDHLSKSSHPKIVMADINSDPRDKNDDGSDTPYKILTGAGYTDLWLDNRNDAASEDGLTWGHNASLTNEEANFTKRIDYVLYKDEGIAGKKKMAWMETYGDDPEDSKTADGKLWGSDHAAVFADMVPFEERPTNKPTTGMPTTSVPTKSPSVTPTFKPTNSGQAKVLLAVLVRFTTTLACVGMVLSML